MAMLEVCGLRKRFGKTEVLKGIDFSLQQGEVLSIIGSSGSGKTTLLRCLNSLETADAGSIFVNGKEVFNAQAQRRLSEAEIRKRRLSFGLVFQSFNLFPQYTVLRNLTLAPELRLKEDLRRKKIDRRAFRSQMEEIAAEAQALLTDVGLSAKANAYPHELSGGQQQRAAIARALMPKPEILCFDEPTSALDPELTGEVLRVIKGLKSRDRTMIVVTHEMEFARGVSDQVIFMCDGVIGESGTAEQVFGNPQTDRLKAFLNTVYG